jgi:hypothetical protein
MALPPLTASGPEATQSVPTDSAAYRFYRVQVLP